jgi:sugar (pentulose or hexulose) kinase
MSARRLLAVDLGASGGKCFVGTFDAGSFSVREIHRFAHEGVSFFLPRKDGTVTERTHWNDTLLYQNIVQGLRSYRRDVSDTLDGIGIDTWGADGNFVSEDGEMLGKVYCYRDHRLDDMVNIVKSRIDARRVYELTGIHFQPFNVSNQLCWFMMNRRDLLRPGARYLPIPTVFYYYLGGVTAVDSSWASVTQLMDVKRRRWSSEILDALGIPPEVMPEIVEPGAILGKLTEPLAASLKLNRAPLVAVGSHDTASAFAAAPVEKTEDALIISSGTWSLVGKLLPNPITTDAAMQANISNEGGIGNTRFLKNCMGTWLVQELRRAWRDKDGKEPPWSALDPMTEQAPAFTAFVDPDDPGFYNPPDMEQAIGAFCRRTGQKAPADRGTALRVVYESLALKYRFVNEQICSACGLKTAVVHIVGGGSRNILLNQFTADCLGLPVFAGPEEATAVGNLMAQAVGLGIFKSMAHAMPVIRASFPIREYRPRAGGEWRQAYERFRRIAK